MDPLRNCCRCSAAFTVFELSSKVSRWYLLQLLTVSLCYFPSRDSCCSSSNCSCMLWATLLPGVNDASDEWNPDGRAGVRAPGTSEDLWTKGWVSFLNLVEERKEETQNKLLSNWSLFSQLGLWGVHWHPVFSGGLDLVLRLLMGKLMRRNELIGPQLTPGMAAGSTWSCDGLR